VLGVFFSNQAKMNSKDSSMTNKQEAKISVNGKEYAVAELDEAAITQITNIKAADAEIRHLNARLAIAQTAHNAYKKALEEALPKDVN
jgi:hypothetical protein